MKPLSAREAEYNYIMQEQAWEQTRLIRKFCRKHNMKITDFDTHPYIEDVVLLAKIKADMYPHLDRSGQGYWSGLWSYVYHKHGKLKNKHLDKLEKYVKLGVLRQTQAQKKRQQFLQARQRLKTQ